MLCLLRNQGFLPPRLAELRSELRQTFGMLSRVGDQTCGLDWQHGLPCLFSVKVIEESEIVNGKKLTPIEKTAGLFWTFWVEVLFCSWLDWWFLVFVDNLAIGTAEAVGATGAAWEFDGRALASPGGLHLLFFFWFFGRVQGGVTKTGAFGGSKVLYRDPLKKKDDQKGSLELSWLDVFCVKKTSLRVGLLGAALRPGDLMQCLAEKNLWFLRCFLGH